MVVGVDPGPDFERHRIREFAELAAAAKHEAFRDVEDYRRENGEYQFLLPKALCEELSQPGPAMHQYFKQFIVCSMTDFGSLVKSIKEVALTATLARKDAATSSEAGPVP